MREQPLECAVERGARRGVAGSPRHRRPWRVAPDADNHPGPADSRSQVRRRSRRGAVLPGARFRARCGPYSPAGVAGNTGEPPRRSMAGARAHGFRGPHAACHAKLRTGKNLASPGPPQIATGRLWVLDGPQRARTRAASGAGGLENSGLVPSRGWACAALAAGVSGADGDGL